MANNVLNFTINLGGTAYTGIAQIDRALNSVNANAKKTDTLLGNINNAAFKFNNIFQTAQTISREHQRDAKDGHDYAVQRQCGGGG